MITNKQYKQDMNTLIDILYMLCPSEKVWLKVWEKYLKDLTERVNAIPDLENTYTGPVADPYPKPTDITLNPATTKGGPDRISARQQDQIDKEKRKREFREQKHENDEPHDLGNVLHIPGEDD